MGADLVDPRDRFFIPLEKEKLTLPLDGCCLNASLQMLAEAFCQNLEAVVTTVSVPFFMATASVQKRRFMQIHMAERIRALKHVAPNQPLTPELERSARQKAEFRMDGESLRIPELVVDELSDFIGNAEFSEACQEILRQGLVLAWGAFEVLARDLEPVSVGAYRPQERPREHRGMVSPG
jgi:hypothetical protein